MVLGLEVWGGFRYFTGGRIRENRAVGKKYVFLEVRICLGAFGEMK